MDSDIQDRAIESIARQFAGGEHKLAGARASELIFGKSKKANEKLMDEIVSRAPGIDRYISVPEEPVTRVTDQGGDPLSKQPENDPNQLYRSNMSNAQAIAEQNEIDSALSAGRERGDNADGGDTVADVGETKLNPEDSSVATPSSPTKNAKPVKPKQD